MTLKPNIQTNTDLNEPKLTQHKQNSNIMTITAQNDSLEPIDNNLEEINPPSYDTACTINTPTTRRRRNTNRNSTSLIQLRDNLQTIRQRLNLLEEPIDGDNVNRQHFEILIITRSRKFGRNQAENSTICYIGIAGLVLLVLLTLYLSVIINFTLG